MPITPLVPYIMVYLIMMQLLFLNEVTISNHNPYSTIIRLINESTIAQFNLNLCYESWAETFTDNIDKF